MHLLLPAMALASGALDRVLDAMAGLHGEPAFDPELRELMGVAFDRHELLPSQEALYAGFLRYASEPHPDDPYGSGGWMEYDQYGGVGVPVEVEGFGNLTIFEPCNWVSNVAYYRAMLELPEELPEEIPAAYAVLAAGSAFFHAGKTSLGSALDVIPIQLIALMLHQETVRGVSYDPVLHDLSPAEQLSGAELTRVFLRIVEEEDLYDWHRLLEAKIRAPDYYLSFGAIVCTLSHLSLPEAAATRLVGALAGELLSTAQAAFLTGEYEPRIVAALGDARPPSGFAGQAAGTVLKLVYAFVWQEEATAGAPYLSSPEANDAGGRAMPGLNAVANWLTGFPHADDELQAAGYVYPGAAGCRVGPSPHAKWHEQSANGLADLAWLCTGVSELLTKEWRGP